MEAMYFKSSEFDSPDLPGSGELMDQDFIADLDQCRHRAGMPFVITSGFRTDQHQAQLKNAGYPVSENSAHLLGRAADIRCRNSEERYRIMAAALSVGLCRIGVGDGFIHLDNAEEVKGGPYVWLY